jgi:hypothetical protein
VLTEGGTLCGSQGENSLHILPQCLTRPEQLPTCVTLVDLAADEIASQMRPENVVEEMFWNSPAWVPSLLPTRCVTDDKKADENHR